jgi:hypothetical protein
MLYAINIEPYVVYDLRKPMQGKPRNSTRMNGRGYGH